MTTSRTATNEPVSPRKALLARLQLATKDEQRPLRVLYANADRILVELSKQAYLYLLPGTGIELTPGNISKRGA